MDNTQSNLGQFSSTDMRYARAGLKREKKINKKENPVRGNVDAFAKYKRNIIHVWFFFFFGVFFLSLSSHSRVFHSYGDVTIAGEGLQISTYARHSWPLSSEGSLTCHTHCDSGPTVYNGHLGGPVTFAPVAERLEVELSLPVFTT